ncbi:hypothetical protein I4U23_012781 [Adineta vaga]|nr:hypothetical protein I4U23_012781 [Adineta vaga]
MTDIIHPPKTMKALRLHEYGSDYRFDIDVPVPTDIDDYEVLIAIKSAGFCHTELLVRDGMFKVNSKPLPLIPSHETAGVIVAMGKKVSSEFKIGDRVGALSLNNVCQQCPDCLNNTPLYCEKSYSTGVSMNGAFAEYQKSDSRWLVPLPDEISFEQAAPLMCAGATVFNAIERCGLQKGQRIALIGLGALGHLGVQIAKCMGLIVVAIDNRQEPLELAQNLKYVPDLTINSNQTDAITALHQIKTLDSTQKHPYPGVDASVVLAEPIQAYQYAFGITNKHGIIVAVGVAREPIPVNTIDLLLRDITLKGSLLASIECARRMVKFVTEHGIQSEIKSYTLEEAATNLIKDYQSPTMKGKFVVNIT